MHKFPCASQLTPAPSQRMRAIMVSTSRIAGTWRMTQRPLVIKAAAIILSTAFFAPDTRTVP